MKRYSRTWFLVVALKSLAVLNFALSFIEFFTAGFYYDISILLRITGDYGARFLTLWALAEGLRMLSYTEAFSRGAYGFMRKMQPGETIVAENLGDEQQIIPFDRLDTD